MLGRRRFLLLGVGSGLAAVLGLAGPSRVDAAATLTVWRLDPDWGYPVPPHGRTSCRCNACHLHAANKVFATQAAAIAGRIHLCCVCRPTSLELLVPDVDTLFPGSTTVIDLRRDDNAAVFAAAVARALVQDPLDPDGFAPSGTPTPPTAPPVPAAAGVGGTLPRTGGDTSTTVVAAAALIALGAAAVVVAAPSDPETT